MLREGYSLSLIFLDLGMVNGADESENGTQLDYLDDH